MTARLLSGGHGFTALARKFERVSTRAAERMGEKGADAAQKVLAKQYADEAGPDGAKWPTKKRPNGKPQGEASGDTKDSARAIPGPSGQILLSVEGASSFLQGGTVNMDARQILPEDALPVQWSEPIDAACVEAIEEVYEGG